MTFSSAWLFRRKGSDTSRRKLETRTMSLSVPVSEVHPSITGHRVCIPRRAVWALGCKPATRVQCSFRTNPGVVGTAYPRSRQPFSTMFQPVREKTPLTIRSKRFGQPRDPPSFSRELQTDHVERSDSNLLALLWLQR